MFIQFLDQYLDVIMGTLAAGCFTVSALVSSAKLGAFIQMIVERALS